MFKVNYMLEHSKGAVVLLMEKSTDDTSNQQERQMNLAWLAGIWEGEGNISLVYGSGKRIMPRASVVNTDPLLITEIKNVLDSLNVGYYEQRRKNSFDGDPRHKDSFVLNIAGMKRVETFTDLLLPYLRGKKRQVAEVVSGFVKRRLQLPKNTKYTFDDLRAVESVRALNRKGTSVSPETTRWPLDWLSAKIPSAAPGDDIVQAA